MCEAAPIIAAEGRGEAVAFFYEQAVGMMGGNQEGGMPAVRTSKRGSRGGASGVPVKVVNEANEEGVGPILRVAPGHGVQRSSTAPGRPVGGVRSLGETPPHGPGSFDEGGDLPPQTAEGVGGVPRCRTSSHEGGEFRSPGVTPHCGPDGAIPVLGCGEKEHMEGGTVVTSRQD